MHHPGLQSHFAVEVENVMEDKPRAHCIRHSRSFINIVISPSRLRQNGCNAPGWKLEEEQKFPSQTFTLVFWKCGRVERWCEIFHRRSSFVLPLKFLFHRLNTFSESNSHSCQRRSQRGRCYSCNTLGSHGSSLQFGNHNLFKIECFQTLLWSDVFCSGLMSQFLLW